MLMAAGKLIRSKAKRDIYEKALKESLEQGLNAAFSQLTATSSLTMYYVENYAEFLRSSVVQKELGAILDPNTGFDVEKLHKTFMGMTYVDHEHGEELPDFKFFQFMDTLISTFYANAKLKPELQPIIMVERLDGICYQMKNYSGQLNSLADYSQTIANNAVEQTHILKQILDGIGDLNETRNRQHVPDTPKNVQIILEGNFEAFNETRREDVLRILATLLEVEREQIRILRAQRGSIVLDLELPAFAANSLLLKHMQKSRVLRRIGLRSIVMDESDQFALPKTEFERLDLRKYDLSQTNFQGSTFIGCRLEFARMKGCNLREVSFQRVNLKGTSFQESDLRGSRFENCVLDYAYFYEAILSSEEQVGSKLFRAWQLLNYAVAVNDFQGVDLSATNLFRADLASMNLTNANLQKTFLFYADLTSSNLEGANLSGAHLRNTNLEYANLRDANLMGCYLEGARLYNTDLRGADLRDARITELDVLDVIHDSSTRWPWDYDYAARTFTSI